MGQDRALLAWEAGAGRGHVTTLGTMADALAQRYLLDAGLRSLDHAVQIAKTCELVFRGPALAYRRGQNHTPRSVPTASWGDYLGDIGFTDPELIRRQVDWWQRLMRERDYRLVVADYAPCAMLAAYGLDIPVIAVGTGFGLPPGDLDAFPDFSPGSAGTRLHDESELLASLNHALLSLGIAPLEALPAIYDCAEQIVRTPPALDPYAGHRKHPPVALHPLPDPGLRLGSGEAIFLYLSSGPGDGGGLPESCLATGLPVVAYAPALDRATIARLAEGGATVLDTAISPDAIARECSVIVHNGQPGTALMGIAAAMPQAALPLHAEHRFHAHALEALQGPANLEAVPLAQWPAFLRNLAASPDAREGALRAREALAPFFAQDHRAMLRQRLSPWLE